MRLSALGLWFITLLSVATHAHSNEEALAFYQKNGLSFVSVEDDSIQYIGSRLLKEIYGQLGIPVTFTVMPGKRALQQSNEGNVDGEVMRTLRIQELYPSLIRLSPHISVVSGSVFTRKDRNIDVDGWSSLSKYHVGVTRGVQYSMDGVENFKNKHLVSTDFSLVEMLRRGRVDLIVTSRCNGLYLLKKMRLENEIQVLSPPVEVLRLYHYLHVKHKALVPIVEDLLVQLAASGELDNMRNRLEEEILADVKAECRQPTLQNLEQNNEPDRSE